MKMTYYILLATLLWGCDTPWQQDSSRAYNNLPSINVLLMDSTTVTNTRQLAGSHSIILLYFSPDCEHCQAEINYLLYNITSLKNVHLVLISPAPISSLRGFAKRFLLDQYPNITLTNDYQYKCYNLFKIRSFPYIIIYNQQHQLTKLYKGETEIERITQAIKS